jgi:hypothetical protein
MASDYLSIRADNERRYGTDIGRIGRMLLADRYDDRTHFIFELLQNAEDELARRPGWNGSRAVTFNLSDTQLRIAHFGRPFDEPDVRGICGIDESTKDRTAIGRFGIGFKSVYAFTDRPEAHSGEEDFAIESYVWPTALPMMPRQSDETVFVLPLRRGDTSAHAEIVEGLHRLGPRSLLFLRQIEEISWTVEGGRSGMYLRGKPEYLGEKVRRIRLIGEEDDEDDAEETWLVFSREVRTEEDKVAGHVEIAFSISQDESGRWSLHAIDDSSLVVFFPTILPTHLGFLVQGPYRTTPSRDNVPRNDPWNQQLVRETAVLLVEALRWRRDEGLLDAATLRCFPLDRTKFGEGTMFGPLFEAVRNALGSEDLLPRFETGHVAAGKSKLARTQELRELFNPSQLARLCGADGELFWLSSDITRDRTPELHQYLMRELFITEVAPESMLPMLTAAFLTPQPDHWMVKLYEFLHGHPALQYQDRFENASLIRLESGDHTSPGLRAWGLPIFMPSSFETGYRTVRRAVCATDKARKFLQSIGLTEADPVDDVVCNVLGNYPVKEVNVDDKQYENDIRRILAAFSTDSKGQREKLIAALQETRFVRAVDAGSGAKLWSKPGEVYIVTERLKELFAGIGGVLFVDDSYLCLRGEEARQLLESCGATRYLKPRKVESPRQVEFPWDKRLKLRERAGTTQSRSPESIVDYSLPGLESFLGALTKLHHNAARQKAELLWDALCDLEQRRRNVFIGTYEGRYHGDRKTCEFEPSFVELLNKAKWVPDKDDALQPPAFVDFDTLDWKTNPFLLSIIHFKPPVIATLAKEAGIEPSVLDLLKKLRVTSEADLRALLKDQPPPPDGAGGRKDEPPSGERGTGGKRTPGSRGGRPFISYLGVHPEEEERDPDGLDQQARMDLEEKSIQLILHSEPQLRRTRRSNPGYDLFEGEDTQPTRWIEAKAMTGSLRDRPVGLSHTQFECARQHREAYWLYVVENAADPEKARVVRIQDPAGKARTFTFDSGWLDIAEVDGAADADT